MMGKKEIQKETAIIDIEKIIPKKHLLKKIASTIDFDFIYEKAAPYYSAIERPSIDPVSMAKNAVGRISVWNKERTTVRGGNNAEHSVPVVLRI